MKKTALVLVIICLFALNSFAEEQRGIEFNNSSIIIPANENWNFGYNDFTMEISLKYDAIDTGDGQVLFQLWGGIYNYIEFSSLWDGRVRAYLFNKDNAEDTPTSLGFYSDFDQLLPNVWYDFAVARKGSEFFIYKDAVLIAYSNTVISTSITDQAYPIELGGQTRYAPWRAQYFDGWMDEFRIWDKALTPEELLYWKDHSPSSTNEDLLGYWDLDGVPLPDPTYYESKMKKYIITIQPDTNGNIYRHYLDEDWGGQGHGRPDKEVKEVADINGAKAYEYFYHENSNVVRIKYCYEAADYTTDPSSVTFSDKVATYEYDLKGRVTTMILEHSNADGELVFEFEYSDETDKITHKHSYKDAEKTKKDKDYEYDEDGNLTIETVYEETKTGWIAEPAYSANSLVAPGSIVDFYDGKMDFFDYSTSTHYTYNSLTGVMTSSVVPNFTPGAQTFDRGQMAWYGSWDLNQPTSEIFFWNGTQTIQLTDNGISDEMPCISNGKIAWYNTRSRDDVFLYDGTQVRNLTNDSLLQGRCHIVDNYITWAQWERWPAPGDIFLYDGANTTRITNDNVDDGGALSIGNGRVVWGRQGDVGYDLYAYNGSGVVKLCDNFAGYTSYTKYGDGWVVWQASDGTDRELYLYDGTSITQLTNNIYDDTFVNVAVGGGKVVWAEFDGHDGELFLYDGKEKTQLTNNDYVDNYPWISGNQIGWLTTGDRVMFGEFGIGGITETIYEYDSEGKLKKKTNENGDVDTYHASGRKESLTLTQPDVSGNTYYHYKDEDNGQGQGKIDKRISETVDSDGARAYVYATVTTGTIEKKGKGFGFGFGNQKEVEYQYSYANADFTDLVATYELDSNGNPIKKIDKRQSARAIRLPAYISRPAQAARTVVPCSIYLGRSETVDRIELRGAMQQPQLPANVIQSSSLADQPKTILFKLR